MSLYLPPSGFLDKQESKAAEFHAKEFPDLYFIGPESCATPTAFFFKIGTGKILWFFQFILRTGMVKPNRNRKGRSN